MNAGAAVDDVLPPAARRLALLVGAAVLVSCHFAYIGEPPSAARVEVTPAAATLSIGDSLLVQAVALDHDDRVVTSRRSVPRWSSGDTTVVRLAPVTVPSLDAAVSAARAHAVRAGVAVLRAESGDRRDSVVVTVR